MKQLRLASSIIKMMIKDRVQYPARLIVDTAGIAARCGVLLILYWYVFQFQGGVIRGISFQVAAWSMFLYFSLMTLRLRDLSRAIMQDIKTGTIEVLLAKPIQYLSYRMWWQLGAGLYPFFVATTLGATTLLVTVGIPETMKSWFFVETFVVTLFLSIVLLLLIYAVVGLFSFWIEDIKPLYWIVDKAVMILGGSYVPVALFPSVLKTLALWSPFGASQFITSTVYNSWESDYLRLIGMQLFWVVSIGIIVLYMFNQAHKKVSVNGG